MPTYMDDVEEASDSDRPFATIHFDHFIRYAEKVCCFFQLTNVVLSVS